MGPSLSGEGIPAPRDREAGSGRVSAVSSRRASLGARPALLSRLCRWPLRPVLKHGPRSLTGARAIGFTKPKGAAKANLWGDAFLHEAPQPRRFTSALPVWSRKSVPVGTRKMVNYAWAGRSQGKPWWRVEAILTCKSIVGPGYRGERLIEPSSSWFLPKFPPG